MTHMIDWYIAKVTTTEMSIDGHPHIVISAPYFSTSDWTLARFEGGLVRGAKWNSDQSRWEIKEPGQALWGRTLAALARECPDYCFAGLDEAVSAYARREQFEDARADALDRLARIRK